MPRYDVACQRILRGIGDREKIRSIIRRAALTKEDAESWVRRMKNEDGSAGEHWDYGQTEQVRQQKGFKCDPVAFYAAMNMIYSDYSQIARETGCNTVDFYAGMAHAFLKDADAPADKIERYMEYIAEA